MSGPIQFDLDALQPVTSSRGVYSTRKGQKSDDIGVRSPAKGHTIDEENGSVIEKDVVDERDIRKKQVSTTSGYLPNS